MPHLSTLVCAGLLCLSLAMPATARAEPDTGEPGIAAAEALVQSRAKPLYRNAPVYPRAALAEGLEGWVVLSYVVREDGSTADPVVEASSGIVMFERAALNAVKHWRFEPATRNGEPVQQCEVRTRLTFAIGQEDEKRGARRAFISEWRRIWALAEDGKLDEAIERTARLGERRGLNLYETARLAMLRAILHYRLQDRHLALASLRSANAGADFLGDPALTRPLREWQLSLELELGEYSRALDSAKWLLEHEGGDAASGPLEKIIDELLALRYGRNYVAVSARIGEWTAVEEAAQETYWTHRLLRRKFGIEDVTGTIRAVDLRCASQRVLTEYAPDIAWTSQEDWGDCDVYVYGEPGTTFRLIEYPLVAGPLKGGSRLKRVLYWPLLNAFS